MNKSSPSSRTSGASSFYSRTKRAQHQERVRSLTPAATNDASPTHQYLVLMSVFIILIYIRTTRLFGVLAFVLAGVCRLLLLFLITILWIRLKVEGKKVVGLFGAWYTFSDLVGKK